MEWSERSAYGVAFVPEDARKRLAVLHKWTVNGQEMAEGSGGSESKVGGTEAGGGTHEVPE